MSASASSPGCRPRKKPVNPALKNFLLNGEPTLGLLKLLRIVNSLLIQDVGLRGDLLAFLLAFSDVLE